MYLCRAPHTKETLLDFRERCQVARHSRVFRGLTGSQRTPRDRGVTLTNDIIYRSMSTTRSVGCPYNINRRSMLN